MDCYLVYSGTAPVSGVDDKLNVPSYDWYIFSRYSRIQLDTFKTLDVGREGKSQIYDKLEPLEVMLGTYKKRTKF